MTRTFWTRLFITGEESWCFAYDPECVGEHSPRPKKLRFQKSKVKTMLMVFFDSQGIVHKEFVQECCTVNAEYYKSVLDRLISHIQRVRPALYRTHDFFPPARQRPGAFGSKNLTVSDSKTSRNIEPPLILARFVSPRRLPVPEVKVAAEGCKIWYN